MTQEPGITVCGLRKRYGRVEALSGVDFTLPHGGVALLVGPNGAGKTSLLKVLMDILPYEAGSVAVLGLDPARDGARIRAAAGFLPEEIQFPFGRLRVHEVLSLHSRYRPGWDAAYAKALADTLELRHDRRWATLSKGESRRVQLACALAHRPSLLLLDEPTDGLDPIGRERVLGLLAEHLAETGATTIYCTHVLHEAQGLADRLIVLGKGRVRLDEDVELLRRTHHRVRFSVRDGAPPPAPFLLREESGGASERRWVVRAGASEIQEWAIAAEVSIIEITPVSLGDTALAYLASSAPPSELEAVGSNVSSASESHHV